MSIAEEIKTASTARKYSIAEHFMLLKPRGKKRVLDAIEKSGHMKRSSFYRYMNLEKNDPSDMKLGAAKFLADLFNIELEELIK